MDIMVEIDSNTAIVEDTNTPLINRSSRPPPKKNMNKKTGLKWHIRSDKFNLYF